MDNFDRVKEFEKAMGTATGRPFSSDLLKLRHDLIDEEVYEAWLECTDKNGGWLPDEKINKANLTKELADILYVVYGTAVTFGLPLQDVFEEVHRSNMSKMGDDGKAVFREDGKVLKGPNYTKPNLEQFFNGEK